MRTLYIECNMGAAGDMLMSALYELLEDRQGFLDTMNGLGLPGVELRAEKGTTCGIAGTHLAVTVYGEEETEPGDDHDHHHGHDHQHEAEHSHAHGHDHDHHHETECRHEHGHDHHHEAECRYEYGHEHHHEVECCCDHEHVHDHAHVHDHGHSHNHAHSHHHADPGHIAELIGSLSLPDSVKREARAVYDAIAEAEAAAHGCPVGDVHFHEVGALDAVADVTGVCYAISLLKPERIIVSPVHVGSGTVRCAHGVMPVPAPATANLLKGVPVYGGAVQGELCTPTGAALLVHFADSFETMPVMRTEGVGIGIGTKQFEQANCVRAFIGETEDESSETVFSGGENGEITELVCNIDDMTPEMLSYAMSRILEKGALDAYAAPGTMKKGRPGHVLTVLCRPEEEERMARCVLEETTTNGLRVRRCGKYFLTPGSRSVQTEYGEVRIKTAEGFGIRHEKPEYEDVAELAQRNSVPCQRVQDAAIRAMEKGEIQ